MKRRRVTLPWIAVAVTFTVSLVFMAWVFNERATGPSIQLTASSGSDPSGLLTGNGRALQWYTDTETVGAWVELAYGRATQVNHIIVVGPGGTATGFTSAVLTFDDGSSLMLTADEAGDAAVTFPERTVSRVRLTVAGVPADTATVALTRLSVDGSGGSTLDDGDGAERVVTTTSSSAGAPASALSDGAPADGDTGLEWTAAQSDLAPWAQLSWIRPREVASVQIFGPTSTAGDDADAPLHGTLRFDDGSTVVVSAIATTGGEATTIAFAPRMATSAHLQFDRSVRAGTAGLREFAVYDVGTTPPRWPQEGIRYSASPPAAGSCAASSAPAATPQPGRLTLVCPSPGSVVDEQATIIVAADAWTLVRAFAWSGVSQAGPLSVNLVASATADADGRAVLSMDTSNLPHGPLSLRVETLAENPGTPLYVQLVNRAGRLAEATGSPPGGMTLQWAEEFTDPLSISGTGAGADYAAAKPDASSSGQFGEALFATPSSGAGTLATVDDDYLRIRARPVDDATGSQAGAQHLAGLLASTDVNGAGFAAQYGWFEARILGAPGAGAWPAFWMLNTESAARRGHTAAEVDAVELFGHSTTGSCHTLHSWGDDPPPTSAAADPACKDPNGFADWAMAWHTYGVQITPNGATFSIDGREIFTRTGLSHSSEPFFFMLDLALGGGWPVDLDSTGGITDMYIDWVHVYT